MVITTTVGRNDGMSEEQHLVPRALREIDFYHDKLIIALVDNEAYVALRPRLDMCLLPGEARSNHRTLSSSHFRRRNNSG